MSRATVILTSNESRARAARWCHQAPPGTRVDFRRLKRTLPQNSRMWAMLTDVSRQTKWHGVHLSPDDWKLLFLDALKRELRILPNIAGDGFVQMGRSSSSLTKEEMSDLMELIAAFGAERGVKFGDCQKISEVVE